MALLQLVFPKMCSLSWSVHLNNQIFIKCLSFKILNVMEAASFWNLLFIILEKLIYWKTKLKVNFPYPEDTNNKWKEPASFETSCSYLYQWSLLKKNEWNKEQKWKINSTKKTQVINYCCVGNTPLLIFKVSPVSLNVPEFEYSENLSSNVSDVWNQTKLNFFQMTIFQ